MNLRKLILRFIYPHKYSSEAYTKYLEKMGCKIGEGTYFFDPITTRIDVGRAKYINIGKYCKITSGVKMLGHDYSWSVLRKSHMEFLPDPGGEVNIGDNVFIGTNSIILKDCTIGDNVIIGAGSVVTKNIPSNSIYGGNPAKFIMTLDEHYERKKKRALEDAKSRAFFIKNNYARKPTLEDMGFFSILFLPRNDESTMKYIENLSYKGDCKPDAIKNFMTIDPIFDSFDSFLEYCFSEERC